MTYRSRARWFNRARERQIGTWIADPVTKTPRPASRLHNDRLKPGRLGLRFADGAGQHGEGLFFQDLSHQEQFPIGNVTDDRIAGMELAR